MRQALELALEALQFALHIGFPESSESQIKKGEKAYQQHRAAITAIKEALAQPEQEPVAFYVYKPTLPRGNLGNVSDSNLPWVYDQDPSSGYSARMLVYTTPPQRTEQEQQIETLKRCLFQMQEAAKDLVKQAKSLPSTQRKPLTDEEIMNIAKVSCIGISPHEDTLNFAKVIEAVHGITASEAEDSARSKT